MSGIAYVKRGEDIIRISFRYKLFISLIVVLVMTAAFISGIWYTHSRNMVTDTMIKSTNLLLNERSRSLSSILENLDYQSRLLSFNNVNVDRGLGNHWKDKYLNTQAINKLNHYIDNMYVSNPTIQALEVGNARGQLYSRGPVRGYHFIEQLGIAALLQEQPNNLLIVPYYDPGLNVKEIMLVRNIHYYGRTIGYSLISTSSSTFDNMFRDVFPENTLIMIQNQRGQTLYTNASYWQMKDKDLLNAIHSSELNNELVVDSSQKEWLMINQPLYSDQMTIHVAVPMAGLLADIGSKFKDIMYIVAMMVGVLLLIVLVVSGWFTRNISILSRAIRRISDGDLEHTINIRGNDEFSSLAKSFNDMTRSIKEYTENIKNNEKEKMDLEIRALQGQINMHFLFNTLNTIKNLSYMQRATNIEKLTKAFMELLRVSMTNGNNYVTLETEVAYVQHFLEIFKYRSTKPITCIVDLADDVKQAKVLKFMLQPIVENAIIHGIEANEADRDGLIYIKAFRQGDDVEVVVVDNGKGFDTDNVQPLNGIGINNTDQRIKVHFGESYGIQIESVLHVSTTVYIKIPYLEEIGQ